MKLHRWHLLLLITIIFIVFLIGLFTGRATVKQHTLSANDRTEGTSSQESNDLEDTRSFVDGKLNINTATADDLILLPGIGDVLAQRIIDYRTENGLFTNVNDLTNVKGIGQAKLQEIIDYITIGG